LSLNRPQCLPGIVVLEQTTTYIRKVPSMGIADREFCCRKTGLEMDARSM